MKAIMHERKPDYKLNVKTRTIKSKKTDTILKRLKKYAILKENRIKIFNIRNGG